MKKKITLIIYLIIMLILSIYMIYTHDDRPEYLKNAESRVASYLGNEYGRGVACESSKISGHIWKLSCLNVTKSKSFEFKVLPEENPDSGVADSFYLEALNDNAKQSAHQGLMQYLNIITP